MTVLAGAVLAAGAGTRMGAPKADLVVNGRRLLDSAVAALTDGGCRPAYAVVRAGAHVTGAQAVVNSDPARGMRSSLELAVAAAETDDAVALAVTLVDLPGLCADAVRVLTSAWRPERIAVATYGGRVGHPVVMSIEDWRAALTLAGPDEGARALLHRRPDSVDRVAVSGRPDDLDTPVDLRRWTRA